MAADRSRFAAIINLIHKLQNTKSMAFNPYFKNKQDNLTPPPFWLKVRKDYILENFRELIEYMMKYPYREGQPNPDYDDTLDCMSELSLDFARDFSSQPYQKIPTFGDVSVNKVVALMGATVLARLKKNVPATDILIPLTALLISAFPDLPQGTQAGLWRVLTHCAVGRRVHRVTFSWRIVSGEQNPRIIAERLAETSFKFTDRPEDRFYLENRGLMVVSSDGGVMLSALNLTDYKTKKPRTQFLAGVGLSPKGIAELKVRIGELERLSDFTTAYKNGTGLMRSLSEFKPSAARRVKEYTEGDVLPAVVIAKTGIKMVVRSIDPDYKQIQGNVYMKLDPDHRPSLDTVRDFLQVGDLVEVTYYKNEKCLFEMTDNLETHYREFGCQVANQTMAAFYDREYPGGSQWITADGLRIGIAAEKIKALNDDELDIYEEAIEKGHPIIVRTYNDAPKKDGPNFYVYAEPVLDSTENIEPFGRQDADENFVDGFLGYCHATYAHLQDSKDPWKPLSTDGADMIARTMAVLADDVSRTSRERFDNLLCAAVACYITGRDADFEFLHHEMLYLSRLVDFAQGREIRPLVEPDEIDDKEAISRRSKMLEQLRGYITPGIEDSGEEEFRTSIDSVDTNLIDRVSKLIDASNSLAGIIRPKELDNIKRTIAATLGVDDEYRSILSDRKWYGEESEQLEFKLSVVFPPLNRRRNNLVADPDGQKWAIIKAVCAFLNSTEGGSLLIGVNDFGFAEGLTADFQELFRLRYISSPDMDHYKQHIMRFLDIAFREQTGDKAGNEIVTGRVKYLPEESPEGKQILRIAVEPYPHDVVEIQGDVPEGMAQSYVRGSGRSQPLTASLASDLKEKKGIKS